MKLRKYRISNLESGQDLGIYEASDVDDALDAMAKDAGYDDFGHACAEAGMSNIVVREVEK
jgi:hypothetical protein